METEDKSGKEKKTVLIQFPTEKVFKEPHMFLIMLSNVINYIIEKYPFMKNVIEKLIKGRMIS